MKVLVTAAGGALAPVNIMHLQDGRSHCKVVAVDVRSDAIGRYFADEFEIVPPGNDPEYVAAIVNIVRAKAVDVVLPWSDEEALALSERKAEIEAAGAVLATEDARTLLTMCDKAETYRLLSEAGVETAHWRVVHNKEQLLKELWELKAVRGEAVVKPLVARGNRGTFVVYSDAGAPKEFLGSRELHLGWDEFTEGFLNEVVSNLPVIVMERLVEPAIDIDVLAYHGKVIHAIPRERINPAGVPFRGSIFRSSPRLLDLAADVTRAFGLSWLYDYDVMHRRDGTPVILEVNPRPSGSIAASLSTGVPLYDDLFDLISGKPVIEVNLPPDGTKSVPYLEIRTIQK
ncbi:ATP-grasp domain-containing protein [Roseobacter sp. HKCCD7870]|uniref:ATP-grasp domain-containing protein n=1 Tax=Roseobacter sp. HKCCD7870 TaxID=3120343 RepID=UPI0030ECF906